MVISLVAAIFSLITDFSVLIGTTPKPTNFEYFASFKYAAKHFAHGAMISLPVVGNIIAYARNNWFD